MKKVNLKGKLSLGKETITKLNNEQLLNVIGGGCGNTVATICCNCTTSCDFTISICGASNCTGASCTC